MATIKTRKKGINYSYDIHQFAKNEKYYARVSKGGMCEFPQILPSNGSLVETILTFHFDRKPTSEECTKFEKHIKNQAIKAAKHIIKMKEFGFTNKDENKLISRFTKAFYTTTELVDKYFKILQ